MADHAPRYLSLPSAELILSEIRPTKIKPETLLSVNIFVDEILWLVLNSARSLGTERLNRDGLMKILPTSLGKEALLEAEVELKAYWDRTDPVHRGTLIEHNSKLSEFPLQAAFELMRAKCEVYSTLGDTEEDIDEENRLQNQMMSASTGPPRASAVAPAALYITAMLEHICEHVLSNVAKVVARDSSRTTAHIQDLYVALCEDDAIYPLFKRMRVKDQLEAQSKAFAKPRRSKSVNTHTTGRNSPGIRGSTSSPQPRPSESMSVGTKGGRTSAESSGPSTLTSPTTRNSAERSRLKMFGGRSTPAEQESQSASKHKRSDSSMSDGMRRTVAAFQDLMDDQHDSRSDFEDLMKSGTTMKVSLTPDRLKTFEVFAKEKNTRNTRSNSLSSVNAPPTQDTPIPIPPVPPVPAAVPSTGSKLSHKGSRSNLVARSAQVKSETIEEDENEDGTAPTSTTPTIMKPRSRTQSLAQFLQETPPWEKENPIAAAPVQSAPPIIIPPKPGRTRSQTTSSNTSPINPPGPVASSQANPSVKKKGSGYLTPTSPPSSFSATRVPGTSKPAPNSGKQGRRPAVKNLEDIDLDELMGDDDDSIMTSPAVETLSPIKKVPTAGSRKNSVSGVSPVSSGTREMMDFLASGPPDAMSPPSPRAVTSGGSLPAKPKSTGRFGRMISRLARSNSSEHMSDKKKGSSAEDVSSSKHTSSNGSAGSLKPPPSLPQWTKPTPPPPPPGPQSMMSPLRSSPSQSTLSSSALGQQPVTPMAGRSRANSVAKTPERPTNSSSREASFVRAGMPLMPKPQQSTVPFGEPTSVVQTPPLVKVPSAQRPSTAPSISTTYEDTAVSMADVEPSMDLPSTSANSSEIDVGQAVTGPSTSTYSVSVGTTEPIGVDKAVTTEPDEEQTPTSAPSHSVGVSFEKAQLMRSLVSRATSVEECQILVEMFLAQWGVPRSADEVEEPTIPDVELTAEEETDQPSVVETLLGDSSPALPSEAPSEDNQTDDAHDADPRTPKTPADERMQLEAYQHQLADGSFTKNDNIEAALFPPSPIIAV